MPPGAMPFEHTPQVLLTSSPGWRFHCPCCRAARLAAQVSGREAPLDCLHWALVDRMCVL